MKRIPEHIREEAALICAIAASSGETTLYHTISNELDASNEAYNLAYRAYGATYGLLPDDEEHPSCIRDAAAEALLRTGWTP